MVTVLSAVVPALTPAGRMLPNPRTTLSPSSFSASSVGLEDEALLRLPAGEGHSVHDRVVVRARLTLGGGGQGDDHLPLRVEAESDGDLHRAPLVNGVAGLLEARRHRRSVVVRDGHGHSGGGDAAVVAAV